MDELTGTVLIVDDEESFSRFLARLLERQGFHTDYVHSGAMARRRMGELFPDVVLMDLELPDADGAELMVELSQKHPDSKFIIITAHGSIRSAVETTRRGVVDYLTKPFEPDALILAIRRALEGLELNEEVKRLRTKGFRGSAEPDSTHPEPSERRFRSPAMREMYSLARRAARQDGIALLLGESGTGKDYLARWIHSRSGRAGGPFFDINCASLPGELAESELFGHEPGAFTGTRGRKRGLLELAKGGTLLLNEIGELTLPLQSKLLTFLDTRSFMRVGGEKPIHVDARLIAATNRVLEAEVEAGRFRSDLYYRLNVFPIKIPPLRDRLPDLPLLVESLLERLTSDLGLGRVPTIAAEALESLGDYSWPGNIRELRNVLERALILSEEPVIDLVHLPRRSASAKWKLEIGFESGKNLHEITKSVTGSLIREALRRTKTKQEAAELLGITRHALSYQCKVSGLDVLK